MQTRSLRWTLLTAAGLSLGILLGLSLQDPLEAIVGMILITPVVTGIVGMSLGAAQWLELRRHLARAHRWLLATAVGLGAGLAAGVVAVEVTGRAILGHPLRLLQLGAPAQTASLLVVGFLAGALLGGVQRLAVRALPRTWPLVSGVGLGLGLALGGVAAHLVAGSLTSTAGLVALVLASGLVLGACTTRVLRHAA
jgi:hypothetical protein